MAESATASSTIPQIKLYQHANAHGLLGSAKRFENIVGYNKGPKGKMPWIELNGTPMADSGLIITHFVESGIADLDTGLSVEEQAISLAFIRMIEEHLYFGTVYRNWVDDDGWATSKNEFFKAVPSLLRGPIGAIARRGVQTQVEKQGLGLHAKDEIYRMVAKDFQALSGLLGSKTYMLGKQSATLLDVVAFSFLYYVLEGPRSPLTDSLNALPNLVAFIAHMKAELVKRGLTAPAKAE